MAKGMVAFILGCLFGMVMTTLTFVVWDNGVYVVEIWHHYIKGKR